MTNQPIKVCSCQSKKNPASTTAAVKSWTATVRATCDEGMLCCTSPLEVVGMIGATSSVRVVLCLSLPPLGTGTLAFSGSVRGVFSSPVSPISSLIPLPQLPLLLADNLCCVLRL